MSHAQPCSCTNHEHDHHHDHHHDHGHHHNHDAHGKKDTPISVTTHDQSIVGTYRFKMEGSYEACSASLSTILQEVADKVTKAGGIVGHIKAHLASAEKGCVISVTDEVADIRPAYQALCHVEGVAIVFGITMDELVEILHHSMPV